MNDQVFAISNPKVNDPQFKAMVNKVTETFKLEIMKSVLSNAEPNQFGVTDAARYKTGGRVHQAVGSYMRRLTPERRKFMAQRLIGRSMVHDSLSKGTFASTLSMKGAVPVLSQLNLAQEYVFLADEKKLEKLAKANILLPQNLDLPAALRARLGSLRPGGSSSSGGTSSSSGSIVMNGGLHFRVHEVKCSSPTDWEWGKDEINMGAVTTDDQGTVAKVSEFQVREDFDRNVAKRYEPVKVLKSFSLSGSEYSKSFSVNLALAEKDSEGFSEFLTKLYEAVKDHINEIMMTLGAAAGAAIGAAVGGSIGTIGGPLGSLIGVAAGLIIGALVGWISSTLKDDIFTPQMAAITIPKAGALFNGSKTSPVSSLSFYDHGGEYRVNYSWEVVWS